MSQLIGSCPPVRNEKAQTEVAWTQLEVIRTRQYDPAMNSTGR